jgi:hypothetical protein
MSTLPDSVPPENAQRANCAVAPGSARVLPQGYIIELAPGGPWLKNDLTWTPDYAERGVWHELVDAELAISRSLQPNIRDDTAVKPPVERNPNE